MALITCPECGGQVSDKAATCIHCGYPLQSQNTTSSNVNKVSENANVIRQQQINSFAPMTLHSVKDDLVSIECGNCNKVYSFKKKYFSSVSGNECIPNVAIICPNCKNGVPARKKIESKKEENTYNIIRCPKCKSTAITTGQRGFSPLTGFWGSNKTVNRCAKCGYSWKPQ